MPMFGPGSGVVAVHTDILRRFRSLEHRNAVKAAVTAQTPTPEEIRAQHAFMSMSHSCMSITALPYRLPIP